MTRHSKPSALSKPPATNRIRIIGGTWRSRVIDFPDAEGLRPTASRVRETVFNWLGQSLHERSCLDLFAGSGVLGFEAASRGAAEVIMVESNREVMRTLKKSKERLLAVQCRLVQQDAVTFLKDNRQKFDIVFLDPPFSSGLMAATLGQLATQLTSDGVVYVEWGEPIDNMLANDRVGGWQVAKQGKAGAVHFGLLFIAKGAA